MIIISFSESEIRGITKNLCSKENLYEFLDKIDGMIKALQ